MAARALAATLIARIVDEGAHSNVLLADAGGPEQRNVHRLVQQTLRLLPPVDATIQQLSSRPLDEVQPVVRAALRVGVMELMTGGDAHGVVNSTVEGVKQGAVPQAAGFVNAILRKVAGGFQPRSTAAGQAAAWAVAAPRWLRDRLIASWGMSEADEFLQATLEVPQIGVRIRPGSSAIGTPIAGIPGAAHVAERSAVVAAGAAVVVMDGASVAVANAVGARPGERVLDVAAAPGNKTAALWDTMEGEGVLVAADSRARRTRNAARRMKALGVGALWVIADGRRPPFPEGGFDRILLDAPCTGLGTVRRRPEIKSRLDPGDPVRMAELQRALVAASLPLLRPGGCLVYSVCTVFPEETIDIAREFGGRPPPNLPGRTWGDGMLLGPHLTDTDGMYITLFG